MLFNKKWIYVLKRSSNGAHKIISHVFLSPPKNRKKNAPRDVRDLWFDVHIVYRISTQLIEQSSKENYVRELHNAELACEFQCTDSVNNLLALERAIPTFIGLRHRNANKNFRLEIRCVCKVKINWKKCAGNCAKVIKSHTMHR